MMCVVYCGMNTRALQGPYHKALINTDICDASGILVSANAAGWLEFLGMVPAVCIYLSEG